jgi:hypothetical protein
LGDTASHSSLSSRGLALLTVAHQALTIVSEPTSLGNVQWMRQTAARFQSRCLSPTMRPVFNTSKSERSFSPIQQCRSSWWSLIKPFPERSHLLAHGLSRVLSLITHTLSAKRSSIEQPLLSAIRKTQLNPVAAANNVCTILDTVAKLPFYIVLRAVLCKLKLSLRCVVSGCTVTSRPACRLCTYALVGK